MLTRLGFRLMGQDQKWVCIANWAAHAFTQGSEMTLQPPNMIEFSMYRSSILLEVTKTGKGREIHE
jgi:hypothetical protein